MAKEKTPMGARLSKLSKTADLHKPVHHENVEPIEFEKSENPKRAMKRKSETEEMTKFIMNIPVELLDKLKFLALKNKTSVASLLIKATRTQYESEL